MRALRSSTKDERRKTNRLQRSSSFVLRSYAGAADGPAEVIDDGVSGILVPPQRPDELTRALERLLADPQLRRRMGAAGRQTVERRFDATTTAAQVMRVYEEVLVG